MRRGFPIGALLIGCVLVGAGAGPATAATEPRSQVDTSSWVEDTVADVQLTVKRPAGWVSPPLSYTPPANVLLTRGNTETGDNMEVVWYREKPYTAWPSGLDEYKKGARRSAQASHGRLLSVSKSKVGGLPAYSSVETYIEQNVRIVYGQLEIRMKDGSVLDVVVDLTAGPNAQATAEKILASVNVG